MTNRLVGRVVLALTIATTACSDTLPTASAIRRVPMIGRTNIIACVTAPSGLVSWWPAEGNEDDVAGGNSGTAQNGVTFAPGMVGQAFNLDGSSAYVSVPDAPSLTPPSNSITLDAWVMPNTVVGPRAIVSKYSANHDASWVLMVLDGHVRFAVSQSGATDIGRTYDSVDPVVAAGVWQHIAGTFDVSTQSVRLYLNGTSIAAVPALDQPQGQVTSIRDSNSPVRIGALQTGDGAVNYFWNGRIDEVDVFDRALSDGEIAAIANAGSAGKCGGPQPPDCGASDVTASVQVIQGTFLAVPPLFNLYSQRVTITNTSSNTLSGLLYLVTDGLPRQNPTVCPLGCGLATAQPLTLCGSPSGSYLIQLPVSALAPRQSVTITLVFSPGAGIPGSAQDKFHYSARVFRGTPQI